MKKVAVLNVYKRLPIAVTMIYSDGTAQTPRFVGAKRAEVAPWVLADLSKAMLVREIKYYVISIQRLAILIQHT